MDNKENNIESNKEHSIEDSKENNIEDSKENSMKNETESSTENRHPRFVGYEYKEVVSENSKVPLLMDGYECFGWEVNEQLSQNAGSTAGADKKVTLYLKRNRSIVNKMELTRLQRNFEACVDEIEKLESSKTSRATAYALALGFAGTAFMALATFAVTAEPPHILLCILFAIPGFLGWAFPCFLYKKEVGRETKRVTPLIEKKYDEIYALCEKGNKLLY